MHGMPFKEDFVATNLELGCPTRIPRRNLEPNTIIGQNLRASCHPRWKRPSGCSLWAPTGPLDGFWVVIDRSSQGVSIGRQHDPGHPCRSEGWRGVTVIQLHVTICCSVSGYACHAIATELCLSSATWRTPSSPWDGVGLNGCLPGKDPSQAPSLRGMCGCTVWFHVCTRAQVLAGEGSGSGWVSVQVPEVPVEPNGAIHTAVN